MSPLQLEPADRVALALAIVLPALIAALMLRLYRPDAPARASIEPGELGPPMRVLALASVFGLFLEMLLIRWVSSEVRIFAYFKNFVLIACYLGFGLGCYRSRRPVPLPALVAGPVTLAALVGLPWAPLRKVFELLPGFIGAFSEVDMWGVPKMPLDADSARALAASLFLITPLFTLLAITFMPVGQLVGALIEGAPDGVGAYTVNVVGSLGGILLYTGLCFLWLPPPVWFLAAGALAARLFARRPRAAALIALAFAGCAALVSFPGDPEVQEFWSPYQKLVLTPGRTRDGELAHYILNTNNTFYQQILNLSPEFVRAHPEPFRQHPMELNAYNRPYWFYPRPPSVLVLGAGMGNDVAAALRNGAEHVVAVEIDPLILELGRRYHFEHPYQSAHVETVVDDARSYLQNCHRKFDLILFSLLDSHTTASHFSNIRIDNFVYTQEALRTAAGLLAPGGVLVVKFAAVQPWIAGRLAALLSDALPGQSVSFRAYQGFATGGSFFVCGDPARLAAGVADPMHAAVTRDNPVISEPAILTSDDWPYFYQRSPGIPVVVLLVSAVVMLVGLVLWSSQKAPGDRVQPHFFFLGAGFMLLEAQSVSRMALLFGTTWLVNSIVIAGVLFFIVAANLVTRRTARATAELGFLGIAVALALNLLLPDRALFFADPILRALAAMALYCGVIFFAGIAFIRGFARASFSGGALGSNLLGALAGGLLESLSLWTGLKALLAVAGLFYLAAFLTRPR